MTTQSSTSRPLQLLLELLRCPCCMSQLARPHPPNPSPHAFMGGSFTREMGGSFTQEGGSEGEALRDTSKQKPTLLRCAGCGRVYTVHRLGDGSLEIPCLMRDDALATLDQDLVVGRSDPDSARLDYRQHIAWAERRERFLAPLVHHTSDLDTSATAVEPTAREQNLANRFAHGLESGGTVLHLGCGAGGWTAWLAGLRLCVVGIDPSLSRLERVATTLAGAGRDVLYAQADAMELPVAAASVDGVWCDAAFASVRPDRRTVFFRQANRALRPGGLLYLGAATAPVGDTWRRYLLGRYLYHRPVVREEWIERPPRGRMGGWRYRATATAHDLRDLCHDHGFKVLALSREGARLFLLARKERGTDA